MFDKQNLIEGAGFVCKFTFDDPEHVAELDEEYLGHQWEWQLQLLRWFYTDLKQRTYAYTVMWCYGDQEIKVNQERTNAACVPRTRKAVDAGGSGMKLKQKTVEISNFMHCWDIDGPSLFTASKST